MPAYDNLHFDPPAPLAHVILRNSITGLMCDNVPMLLDSGADVTLLPARTLPVLGLTASSDRQYELRAFDGNITTAPVVTLELVFCRRTFRGQFLLIEQEWGIIGRNILNVVRLLFDGPQGIWDEQRPTST